MTAAAFCSSPDDCGQDKYYADQIQALHEKSQRDSARLLQQLDEDMRHGEQQWRLRGIEQQNEEILEGIRALRNESGL